MVESTVQDRFSPVNHCESMNASVVQTEALFFLAALLALPTVLADDVDNLTDNDGNESEATFV